MDEKKELEAALARLQERAHRAGGGEPLKENAAEAERAEGRRP